MTNTFKTIAIAALTVASMVAGIQTSNASGMNALASLETNTTVSKVGFFKKGGKFTNRGVATIGIASALAGGLIANKVVKSRNNGYRERDTYDRPARYKSRRHYTKLGYNAGVADGKMGRNTRTAASQFQLANGMPATGYLTPQQTGLSM